MVNSRGRSVYLRALPSLFEVSLHSGPYRCLVHPVVGCWSYFNGCGWSVRLSGTVSQAHPTPRPEHQSLTLSDTHWKLSCSSSTSRPTIGHWGLSIHFNVHDGRPTGPSLTGQDSKTLSLRSFVSDTINRKFKIGSFNVYVHFCTCTLWCI